MNEIQNATPRDKWADLLAIGLAIALLAMLFPTSERIVGSQPWRVEMLTTLVLFVCMGAAYARDKAFIGRMFLIDNAGVKWIVLSLTAFVLWGLISTLWAHSPLAAWHHTLVWANYIIFFLFAREQIRSTGNYKFITTAFLTLAGIISIVCLIDYVTLPDFTSLEGTLRMRYSKYAELLITALPLTWAAALYVKKRTNYIVVLAAAAAGWLTVMLSLSKGAFLAGIVGIGLMFAGAFMFGNRRFQPRLLASLGLWVAITLITQVGFSFFSTIPSTSNYLSGSSGSIRESSLARKFVWGVGGQMARDSWITGVGANNFGVMFNESRADYRINNPNDPKYEVLSEQVPERAHNEMLQVLAELGIVGALILLAPAALFATMLYRAARGGYGGSPMLWAALGGISAFAASSMISSFSFRLAQNGIVFFLVLAVAISELRKAGKRPISPKTTNFRTAPAAVFASVSLFLMIGIATFTLKAAAEYFASSADQEKHPEAATELYAFASRLDRENGMFYLRSSARSRKEKDFAKAAREQRRAIDNGLGIVLTYSILADDQSKVGDPVATESTLVEALRIFPRSVFLRVRYAFHLEAVGRIPEAEAQFSTAMKIDGPQAGGWYNILRNGSVSAFYAARTDPSVATPADLRPEAAVLLYLDAVPGEGL